MRTSKKTTTLIASGAALAVAAAALAAPGAAAAESVDGEVNISNTETVSVLMGADGEVDAQRVYDQLVLSGKGTVDVSNPVSTDGLRNLDGFSGWEVTDGAQRIKTDVDGEQKYRSVANYDKDLPVSIDVRYTLDGKKVEPGDVVGESGELEVSYTVTNETAEQQEVEYADGEGNTKTSLQAVVIPMVGSMTTVLPSTFRNVETEGANAAGDGKGGTQLSFTMTLFPPIGSDRATFGYKATIEDGVVPEASLSLLPVNPLENTSFKGGAASYKGGADSGTDLTAGAVTIDENLLKIRDGANDLVDGLIQLRDGANELNTGLAGKAAPGAAELAAGAGQLSSGAGELDAGAKKLDAGAGELRAGTRDLDAGASKLAKGAGDLSKGLNDAKAGAPALITGVQELKAGAERVDAGLQQLNSGVSAGGQEFKDTFAGSVDGGMAQVITGLTPAINGALDNLNALVQDSETATPLEKGTFDANVQGTKSALVAGLTNALTGAEGLAPALKSGVNDGVDELTGGVAGGVGTPTSTVPLPDGGTGPSLRNGVGQLIAGLGELETKGGGLVDGINQLAAGGNQLKAGTGDLKDGTGKLRTGAGTLAGGTGDLSDGTGPLSAGSGELATGAGTLSAGLGDAASGSGQLAEGLQTAAESAPDLPEGAQQLSDEGTSQLVNVGNGTAMDYGLKYALIEAGSARAASTQPYGSPSESSELTAYKYELAGETGQTSGNAKRGIAVALLAAGALALMALRRRGSVV
ncbi:hypothetical protein ACHAAC_05090 [Aeromicrobium sp. CF4.19]|uniref:hypothetical protein n=1 Tax=Aeromicrobium sp. CF4.19 TaxID=3373082 RepID=UPI003EE7E52A